MSFTELCKNARKLIAIGATAGIIFFTATSAHADEFEPTPCVLVNVANTGSQTSTANQCQEGTQGDSLHEAGQEQGTGAESVEDNLATEPEAPETSLPTDSEQQDNNVPADQEEPSTNAEENLSDPEEEVAPEDVALPEGVEPEEENDLENSVAVEPSVDQVDQADQVDQVDQVEDEGTPSSKAPSVNIETAILVNQTEDDDHMVLSNSEYLSSWRLVEAPVPTVAEPIVSEPTVKATAKGVANAPELAKTGMNSLLVGALFGAIMLVGVGVYVRVSAQRPTLNQKPLI